MLLPHTDVEGLRDAVLLYARADNSTDSKDDSSKKSGGSKTIIIVVVIIVIAFIILGLLGWLYLRRLRARNASPKFVPSESLKNKWRDWTSNRGRYSDRLQPNASVPTLRAPPRGRRSRSHSPALEELRTRDSSTSRVDSTIGATIARDAERGVRGTPAGNQEAVDRHTSVRSVMTLPAYSAAARESEQIIGREGERGGIDVVLEFPETQDDEEQRREAEMESLYQIRRARRAEAADREERRRLRREARARGDWAEVERLRLEAEERRQRQERQLLGEDVVDGEQRTAARLIAEHQEENQRRERERRVSSVQYAELGVARHDGSRVRAGSNASARSEDARPLLDSAAGMGDSGRRGTMSTLGDTLSVHHRNRSASSVFSLSSNEGDDDDGSMYHPPFAPPMDAGPGFHERGRSITSISQNSSPDFEVVSLHSTADGPSADTPHSTTPRPSSRNASMSRLSQSISADGGPPRISIDPGERQPSSARAMAENGVEETPIEAPPHYEHLAANAFGEPPNYESPVRNRGDAPQLPGLNRLPSIRIEESHSPMRSPGGVVSPIRANEEGSGSRESVVSP